MEKSRERATINWWRSSYTNTSTYNINLWMARVLWLEDDRQHGHPNKIYYMIVWWRAVYTLWITQGENLRRRRKEQRLNYELVINYFRDDKSSVSVSSMFLHEKATHKHLSRFYETWEQARKITNVSLLYYFFFCSSISYY